MTEILLRGFSLWFHIPGLFDAVKFLAASYLSTVALYAGFLAYCTAARFKREGRLSTMPWLVRGHIYAIVYFFLLFDIAFNVTLGSLIFLELPEIRRLTFTARCKKHMNDPGWRGAVARFVCHGWLNPGDPGHC